MVRRIEALAVATGQQKSDGASEIRADQDVGGGEVFVEMIDKKQLFDSWFFGRGGIGAWPGQGTGWRRKSTKTIHFGGSKVGGL